MEEKVPARISACGGEGKGYAEEGMVMLKENLGPGQADYDSTFLRLLLYVPYV
jgi:hypothetical protein